MSGPAPAKLMLIYLDETDTWGATGQPLYRAIMGRLLQLDVSGATAQLGLLGFGVNRRIHEPGLFGVSDDRPVIIGVVESEEKLRAILPELRTMVREGLIFLLEGEVLHTGARREAQS